MPYEPKLKSVLNVIFNRFADEIVAAVRSYDRSQAKALPVPTKAKKTQKTSKPALPAKKVEVKKIEITKMGDLYLATMPNGKAWSRKRFNDITRAIRNAGFEPVLAKPLAPAGNTKPVDPPKALLPKKEKKVESKTVAITSVPGGWGATLPNGQLFTRVRYRDLVYCLKKAGFDGVKA